MKKNLIISACMIGLLSLSASAQTFTTKKKVIEQMRTANSYFMKK